MALDTDTKRVQFIYGGSLTNFAKPEHAGCFLLRQDCIAWVKANIEDLDTFLQDQNEMQALFPFTEHPRALFF